MGLGFQLALLIFETIGLPRIGVRGHRENIGYQRLHVRRTQVREWHAALLHASGVVSQQILKHAGRKQ